ncbi:hypothetical protein BGZ76_000492 [Entomortierella beljakovae]|nr:hypothetical protein BGZ76_000492 [Entomortierella beljakovae]
MLRSPPKLSLITLALLLSASLVIQFHSLSRDTNAIWTSTYESHKPLQVPITIVTAASANHACALEAFLYHMNDVLSQLNTSPKNDKLMRESRRLRGERYLDKSPDFADIRDMVKDTTAISNKGKGKGDIKNPEIKRGVVSKEEQNSQSDSNTETVHVQNQEHDVNELLYEIKPKIVVYNMGMGPTKQRKLQFKAMVEAGYMDEIYDFDFDKYPDFWRLNPKTRGEYGWKSGIIGEVSQRILQPNSTPSDETKLRKQTASEEQEDEGPLTSVDDKALDQLELDQNLLKRAYKITPVNSTQQSLHKPEILLWMDSGDRPSVDFFRWLPGFMKGHGLWTPQSQDTMEMWTHPGMLDYYHSSLSNFAVDETNCNAAIMAFDVKNKTITEGIMKEWMQCSLTKECIAPEGSSRANHRQDQAALTYLVKTMGFRDDLCHGFPEVFGVKTNRDRYCKEDIAIRSNRIGSK